VLARTEETSERGARKAEAWGKFETWATEQWLGGNHSADVFIDRVVEYGQHCYDEDLPRHWFADVVAALSDRQPQWSLRVAWRAVRKWEIAEPAATRLPLPPLVVFGLISLALLWEVPEVALGMALLWEGAFRPGELFGANFADFSVVMLEDIFLPEDSFGIFARCGFLSIKKPKTRGKSASTQVGRIESRQILEWLRFVRQKRESDRDRRLVRLTYVQFSRAFRLLTAELGLSEYTLGCFRPGRATMLYEECRDMERVRHLLRHDHLLSTDRYVQEVQSCLAATRLKPDQKHFINLLASTCPRRLELFLSR
jgi:hypothetical protein